MTKIKTELAQRIYLLNSLADVAAAINENGGNINDDVPYSEYGKKFNELFGSSLVFNEPYKLHEEGAQEWPMQQTYNPASQRFISTGNNSLYYSEDGVNWVQTVESANDVAGTPLVCVDGVVYGMTLSGKLFSTVDGETYDVNDVEGFSASSYITGANGKLMTFALSGTNSHLIDIATLTVIDTGKEMSWAMVSDTGEFYGYENSSGSMYKYDMANNEWNVVYEIPSDGIELDDGYTFDWYDLYGLFDGKIILMGQAWKEADDDIVNEWVSMISDDDGQTWTTTVLPEISTQMFSAILPEIVYRGGKLFISLVDEDNNQTPHIFWSNDGMKWTDSGVAIEGQYPVWFSYSYGNDKWLVFDDTGEYAVTAELA